MNAMRIAYFDSTIRKDMAWFDTNVERDFAHSMIQYNLILHYTLLSIYEGTLDACKSFLIQIAEK